MEGVPAERKSLLGGFHAEDVSDEGFDGRVVEEQRGRELTLEGAAKALAQRQRRLRIEAKVHEGRATLDLVMVHFQNFRDHRSEKLLQRSWRPGIDHECSAATYLVCKSEFSFLLLSRFEDAQKAAIGLAFYSIARIIHMTKQVNPDNELQEFASSAELHR